MTDQEFIKVLTGEIKLEPQFTKRKYQDLSNKKLYHGLMRLRPDLSMEDAEDAGEYLDEMATRYLDILDKRYNKQK